jgi:hypothetical protein
MGGWVCYIKVHSRDGIHNDRNYSPSAVKFLTKYYGGFFTSSLSCNSLKQKQNFFVLCQVIQHLSQPPAPVHTPFWGRQVNKKVKLQRSESIKK